jgi:ketopantoate reductase
MQKVQKVAILGAGALGACIATRFFQTPGFSTVLIATGQRLESLKKDGLVVNQASAVIYATYGVFQTSPEAQGLMEAMMAEVVTLAKARNGNLTEQDIQDWYPVLHKLSPQGKTSMLQDIEATRKTEVEVFSGRVIQLGKDCGIPTPVNQTVFRIIRVM